MTELARPVNRPRLVGGDVWVDARTGLTGWSGSGGGVGGNTLRLIGGSDRCLVRLLMSGFTRFDAAKEMLSSGRPSRLRSTTAAFILVISGPAKPVEVLLLLSDEAINRAFPR